jgi:hypothetical protein
MNPDDPRHGTDNAYTNLRCRCERCREAHRLHARRSPSHRAANRAYVLAARWILDNQPDVWASILDQAYGEMNATRQPVGRPKGQREQ